MEQINLFSGKTGMLSGLVQRQSYNTKMSKLKINSQCVWKTLPIASNGNTPLQLHPSQTS